MALFLLAGCGSTTSPALAPVGHDASSTTTPAATARPTDSPAPTPQPTVVRAAAAAQTTVRLPMTAAQSAAVTFAVIGDDGMRTEAEKQVAQLVKSWRPDLILDTGDVYYTEAGGYTTDKYDRSLGTFYCDFLKDVTTTGKDCPHGNASVNRFFPTLGNHDYSAGGLDNYLQYFTLPGRDFTNTSGNERYYDFTWGPVHFFSVNSNADEPDGATADSKQGKWLKQQLAKSKSTWNVVFFHHPPYSSGATHGADDGMRWPFEKWGVTAVFSGHEHLYERLIENGVVYFINGLGGATRYSFDPTPAPGSQARVANNWGAQKVTATDKQITFEFYTVDGKRADIYTINK